MNLSRPMTDRELGPAGQRLVRDAARGGRERPAARRAVPVQAWAVPGRLRVAIRGDVATRVLRPARVLVPLRNRADLVITGAGRLQIDLEATLLVGMGAFRLPRELDD